ncbi:DEAD/DEAH box helicase [Clostridium massiliamazoniense]|uniref:DEAD/DEAH box helicase n=1 Tax=Clostridium massiliamazoniense TaxID=1347366 RepID=UPI0006D7C69F|nr:DEAD/DEAH box helicase [Clostridium massiliamazoniense]
MYVQTQLDLGLFDSVGDKSSHEENKSSNIIDSILERKNDFIEHKLITNGEDGNFLLELKEAFNGCKSFYFSVAFINFSGLQLILDQLKEMENRGIKGTVITSTYLNFTQSTALRKLSSFDNIDLRIFITDEKLRGFHTKVYIFEYEDFYKIYIGSSNLTQSALKSNEEWNVRVMSKREQTFTKEIMDAYSKLLQECHKVDEHFINDYESFLKEIKKGKPIEQSRSFLLKYEKIRPNVMQSRALENLHRLRSHGGKRSLVIAATGTGKTYMSAFDVKEFNPKRMLFIVHREDILRKAMTDYAKIMPEKTFGLFTGNIKESEKDYIFGTIQSISTHYEEFKEDDFDYIVIDEAHHSASESYKAVIDYFKPKFLLGMTATPERTEGTDIFSIFHNNVALEVRLNEALEKSLVVPFHYFGITDIDLVDYSGIDINDIGKVSKLLEINERVDFIIEKMNFYGFDGYKRKAVGFCASVEHAEYMAREFNKRGIKSTALTGSSSISKRQSEIAKLEDDKDDLEVIFTVDLFNEGIDIPSINLVLMLRPTQSSIIFIQQLGRGLRKYKEKEFLTVLDFIGNYNKAFQIAIALNGAKYYDKESLKVSIKTDFSNIPGCTNIQMDEIAKERILEQIDRENFNTMKYLKEEYNEFKKINGGRVVNLLTDYFTFEGAPNPLKFIGAIPSKSYLGFLEKVEGNFDDLKLLKNEKFKLVLKDISAKLPLKRPFEFIIIRYLIKNGIATRDELKNDIEKYIDFIDEETFSYTIECLRGDYHSKKESNFNFIEDLGEKIILAPELKEVIEEEKFKLYIDDCINYGLLTYEREFGTENYGMPFLKLYSQYTRDDVVRMSNATKKFGGYGMGGLKTNGNDWYMFVGMEKEKDIKESINHENEFIGRDVFVWQSRNTTTIESEAGQKLINNVKENINMHLFVRKYREIDGVVEPYIYMGMGDTVYYEGEKPITVHLKLRNKVPMKIYNELK